MGWDPYGGCGQVWAAWRGVCSVSKQGLDQQQVPTHSRHLQGLNQRPLHSGRGAWGAQEGVGTGLHGCRLLGATLRTPVYTVRPGEARDGAHDRLT